MFFKYLEEETNHPLIEHFYEFRLDKGDVPFSSYIVPIGFTIISYTFSTEKQICYHKENVLSYYDLSLAGQFFGCYLVKIKKPSRNIGFALKPTALYKLTKNDVSEITNNFVQLEDFDNQLYKMLDPIFKYDSQNHEQFIVKIFDTFKELEIYEDVHTNNIDKAIAIIREKKGLLSVGELLKEIPYSQRSFENWFKKIVGLSPGKYIKQYRFSELMRQYQSNEIPVKELIYLYNYYDAAHFYKDFELFTGQKIKEFFKHDFSLIEKYLITKD